MTIADPHALLQTLCRQPRETEWLEFKHNNFDPNEIGEYVSALANSAILVNEERAYLVFGVENKTHRILGTTVSLKDAMVGNEVFENWLCRGLNPRINLEIVEFEYFRHRMVMIVIDPAYQRPVRFNNEAYIRVASVKKLLRDQPERERALWAIVSRFSFEQGTAAAHLSKNDIIEKFHCDALLDLLERPARKSIEATIEQLTMDHLVIDDKQGGYDATNLFALVAARKFDQFPLLKKKAPRVVYYQGSDKSVAISDQEGNVGYAIAFKRLLKYITDLLPQNEDMVGGKRVQAIMYPEIAIREFLANALIHQDLTVSGSSPLIEIFIDKIEITNPGAPLVDPVRFIDAPARSRNEKLASLMRRAGFAEERGSGIDRAVQAIEDKGLPPPLFRKVEDSTVVTLFGKRLFSQMSPDDRIRACYQHACLKFLAGDPMKNASLRVRLGLTEGQYPQASIVIKDAISAKLIKPLDAEQSNRLARYVPYWVYGP